jgi:membrane fusion protein, copper/silver efflux system
MPHFTSELVRRHWGKLIILAVLVAAIATVPFLAPSHHADPVAAPASYYCPMHPTYTSAVPGDCPICGMALVLAAPQADRSHPPASPAADLADVHATPEQVALAGVRTAKAEDGVVVAQIRAVGNVVADETRIRQVTSKIAGWIEVLHVSTVGQLVRAGDPLFDLYSPELLASQEEYLRARQTAADFEHSALPEIRRGGQDLAVAARRRLELFDVPREFLDTLEQTGKVQRTVRFRAPFSGYVTEKAVFVGQRIDAGAPLMTVTDLSRVWVIAQLYENEAASAVVGRPAVLVPQYDRTRQLPGRIGLVYPTMDAESRTIRVRFDVANPAVALKPGMFVDVELLGTVARGVVVPDSAIIETGERQVMFVRATDGTFQPRDVVVGERASGRAVIRNGLRSGEDVAVSANFLLDSESRLKSALASQTPGVGAPAAAAGK